YHLQPMRARGVKVDRHEDARNADLVVLEWVMSGVQVSIDLQADARTEFLGQSDLKIILCIGAHIADALCWINGIVSDKAGQQRILNRRRREVTVIRGAQHRLGWNDVLCQSPSRVGLHASVNQIEVVVPHAEVDRQIAKRREVVLNVRTRLATE